MKTNHFGGCFKLGSIFTSLLFLLYLAQAGAATTGLETWENTFSFSRVAQQLPLQKIAVSNHRFLATSAEGRYLYSDDGLLWAKGTNSIFSGPLAGLAAGSGMFVAASSSSSLYSSADGTHWTNYPLAQKIRPGAVRDLIYGNGLFVTLGGQTAASTNHTFLTSPNGVNWQRKDEALSDRMTAIAAGQGRFIGVGSGGTIWNSNEAADWAEVAHVPAVFSDCAYGEGWFVAVGNSGTMAISDDASHWHLVASGISRNIATVRFAGGIFYAATMDGPLFAFEIQTDGQIHYLIAPGSAAAAFGINSTPVDIACDSGRYIAVGSYSGRSSAIWDSSDGINWNIVIGSDGSSEISGIAVAGHRYFAFGEGPSIPSTARTSFVLSSADLISWQRNDSPADPLSRTGYIGFGNEVFAFEGPRILASADGLQWNVRYAEMKSASPSFSVDSTTGTLIAWGGWTSSNAVVATTQDGVAWQRHAFPALPPVNLTAAGNNTVVGAWSPQPASSTAFVTLDLTRDSLVQTQDAILGVYALAYGNGVFVALGHDRIGRGVSLVSHDGKNWKRNDAPSVTGAPVQLVYANGWFVLGTSYASADGVTWLKLPGDVRARLVFDGKQLIGTDGTAIFHSQDIVPPFTMNASVDTKEFVVNRTSFDEMNINSLRRETDGSISLQVDGSAGQSGAIEVSEDLRTWIPLTGQSDAFSLKDADAQGRPMRFYRLKPAP